MMKYLIDDRRNVLIFSKAVLHSEVRSHLPGELISGGFVYVTDRKSAPPAVKAHGHSISCRVASRPEDSKIIAEELDLINKFD